MQAGQLAQLNASASDRLEDTTENDRSLPALAVNSTQTDLGGDSAVQHCTAGATVTTEQEEVVVYDGGITSNMVKGRKEVVSDVVADVTGSGVVIAERTAGGGRYQFPYDLIVAQTERDITTYRVNIRSFVDQFEENDIRDTWMVGTDDGEGATIDYNDHAKPENAPEATIGIGFDLIWNGTLAEGVVYESGYIAIYSGWTAAVFAEFVTDAVMPHAYADDDGSEQQTL